MEWGADEGPPGKFMSLLVENCASYISMARFIPTGDHVVTNTATGVCFVFATISTIVDGHGCVPVTSETALTTDIFFELHINTKHKITLIREIHDPTALRKSMASVASAFEKITLQEIVYHDTPSVELSAKPAASGHAEDAEDDAYYFVDEVIIDFNDKPQTNRRKRPRKIR